MPLPLSNAPNQKKEHLIEKSVPIIVRIGTLADIDPKLLETAYNISLEGEGNLTEEVEMPTEPLPIRV